MSDIERNELPEILFEQMKMIQYYPEGVEKVPEMIKEKTAFFPGGRGLWMEEVTDVFPTILVLGHDFSTLDEHKKMLAGEMSDLKTQTWINMRSLFKEVGIDLKDCFFSNVFMGLRVADSSTGDFSGFKDKIFIEENKKFLSTQIETIEPKIIITLGMGAAEMIADTSVSGLESWKNLKALREPNIGIQNHVHFENYSCRCVALEHPSLRNGNVKRRVYVKTYVGNAAEVMMLKDIMK